ncbi:hypothetical protein RCDURKIN_136 [Rhodobacter phage RcDurkin]|nr:hypothetical protein RCDURKIN_136 [Rhodobacter phage RcDurkin]
MAMYRVTLMADDVECVIAALVEADSKDDAVQKVVEANIAEGKMCVSVHWRADVHSVN